jgi:membrane fusion protein (multidrug efflux system)
MNVTKIVFGAAALLVMTSCGGGSNPFGKTDTSPKAYKTQVVNGQNVQLETVYPTTIKGEDDTEIRPRIDGFIEAIYVDEGSVVKKGQSLFKINSPTSQQAVTTAQAAVESAKAQVATAQLNVSRIKPLADKGIVSITELATYQNALETAQAGQVQAQASLTNALAQQSWTNVASPVNGVVGAIAYRLGSLVNNTYVLTTVSSTNSVYAYFSINEKDLLTLLGNLPGNTQAEKINNLPEVSLKMANGNIYSEKGKIKTITGLVDVATGTVTLRAEFPNPHGELRSGFSGNVIIPKQMNNAIVIPQDATKTQQNKYLAYKVQGDTMAVQTLITVIPTPDGKSYVVTSGLNDGDRIVTEGMVTITDGTKVIVKK